MTWTSAFGRACAVLLRTIVRWLALTKINPNVLTFMGLVVNAWAAFFFGYATAENQQRMFFYAGLVIIGVLFNRMAPVLWIIAVLSTLTVIHRIQYTWARTSGPEAMKGSQAA